MKHENIPQYLKAHAAADLTIEFDDGDKYTAAAVQLWGENDDGEFELRVSFDDCLGLSNSYAQAVDAGSLDRYPGVWWTSDKPRRPVGKSYTVDQIRSITDNDAGYCVYEREP